MSLKKVTDLPESVVRLIKHGIRIVDPQKILLFGSRARGDFHDHSDYDLAFDFDETCCKGWLTFKEDAKELPLTLRKVDLVSLSEVSAGFRERIEAEGILVYEQNRNQKTNFKSALEQLSEYLSEPILTNRDRSGVIQAFKFTFEAFIKLCEALLVDRGLASRFPRDALEGAIDLGFWAVDDGEIALNMLSDRNATSHLYNQELASAVFNRIKDNYHRLFLLGFKHIEEKL